jgi:hypothetical protein
MVKQTISRYTAHVPLIKEELLTEVQIFDAVKFVKF